MPDYDLYDNPDPATLWSLSGDWSTLTPGIRVRLWDAPNEEGMQEHFRCPDGIVILQTDITLNDTLHLKIRRWAEHELALLQGSGVRNYAQEQIVNAVLHRLTTGDWGTGEDES